MLYYFLVSSDYTTSIIILSHSKLDYTLPMPLGRLSIPVGMGMVYKPC